MLCPARCCRLACPTACCAAIAAIPCNSSLGRRATPLPVSTEKVLPGPAACSLRALLAAERLPRRGVARCAWRGGQRAATGRKGGDRHGSFAAVGPAGPAPQPGFYPARLLSAWAAVGLLPDACGHEVRPACPACPSRPFFAVFLSRISNFARLAACVPGPVA